MEGRQIVELLWNRKESAVMELQNAYGRYCYAISYRIVRDREDAKECLNDTWLAAWNSIPNEYPDNLRAYVALIIRNLSINRITEKNAWKRGKGEIPAVYEDIEEMLGGSNPIERWIEKESFEKVLNRFLRGLEPAERGIFILRFWHCYSPKEIAKKYEIKEKAVYNILFRLKKEFRIFWKKEVENGR